MLVVGRTQARTPQFGYFQFNGYMKSIFYRDLVYWMSLGIFCFSLTFLKFYALNCYIQNPIIQQQMKSQQLSPNSEIQVKQELDFQLNAPINHQKPFNNSYSESFANPQNKTLKKKTPHYRKYHIKDLDQWDLSQIQGIFRFYDANGPQWKTMSLEIPYRTANNLKNKFYTILRNLIKLIFRKNPESCPRISGQISSKDLCRLYDGRQSNFLGYIKVYQQFAGFLRQLLKASNYDLQNRKIGQLAISNADMVKRIYLTIYKERLNENEIKREENYANSLQPKPQSEDPEIKQQSEQPVVQELYRNQNISHNMSNSPNPYCFYMVYLPSPHLNCHFYPDLV